MKRNRVRIAMEEIQPLLIETLRSEGKVYFSPTGTSMLPFLKNGTDRVMLEAHHGNFAKNDIYLFHDDMGKYYLHRLIKVSGDTLNFCGDNLTVPERNIPKSAVLARLTIITRNARTVSLTSPSYRLYCLLLPLRRVYLKIKRGFIHLFTT